MPSCTMSLLMWQCCSEQDLNPSSNVTVTSQAVSQENNAISQKHLRCAQMKFSACGFLAPSGAQGVVISVSLSVCLTVVTVISCLEHSIFIFLAQIFKLFSQHSYSALSLHFLGTLLALSQAHTSNTSSYRWSLNYFVLSRMLIHEYKDFLSSSGSGPCPGQVKVR